MDPQRDLQDLPKMPGPHLETHSSKYNLIFPEMEKKKGREIEKLEGKGKC